MDKQKGFTLIELMIVVAIIGILAAIAIPAYRDYTNRARVSEGLVLASGVKAGVVEYYANTGTWPDGITRLGYRSNNTVAGNAVADIRVNDGGIISINYKKMLDPYAGPKENWKKERTVKLIPTDNNGSISWKCRSARSSDKMYKNPMEQRYLPAECRD